MEKKQNARSLKMTGTDRQTKHKLTSLQHIRPDTQDETWTLLASSFSSLFLSSSLHLQIAPVVPSLCPPTFRKPLQEKEDGSTSLGIRPMDELATSPATWRRTGCQTLAWSEGWCLKWLMMFWGTLFTNLTTLIVDIQDDGGAIDIGWASL